MHCINVMTGALAHGTDTGAPSVSTAALHTRDMDAFVGWMEAAKVMAGAVAGQGLIRRRVRCRPAC